MNKEVYAYVVENREDALAYPVSWCPEYKGATVVFDEIVYDEEGSKGGVFYVFGPDYPGEPQAIHTFRGTYDQAEDKFPNNEGVIPVECVAVWQTKEQAFDWLAEMDESVRITLGLRA